MVYKYVLRARIVLGGIIVAACGLVIALYSVQITQGDAYAARADRRYANSVKTFFDRGSIFFTAKNGDRQVAATLTTTFEVSMNPVLVTDDQGAYDVLSQYIEIDQESFLRKARMENDPYEEVAKKVDETAAESIRNLALPGISVTRESRRSYPGQGIAAHMIGIVGEGENGSLVGKYGLERAYEDVLERSGKSTGGSIFTQIFTGTHTDQSTESQQGTIITSLEPTVQAYLESVLSKTTETWNPEHIGALIIDPRTGTIIAAAAQPTFDPNDLSTIESPTVLSNPLVENIYELGSIMKPLTVAIGLDTGAITSATTYDDTGTLTLSGRRISNFDGRARGVVNVQEILSQSLNVGAATVALKVGAKDFATYIKSLGFTEKTGIDQPNEAIGINNLESARDIEVATASYGQGISVSPIEMVRALVSLANGGMLIKPHIATQIEYADGTHKVLEYGLGDRVFTQKSVEDVTRMLVRVVDTTLRNGALKLKGYSVAAKTGTAQIPDPVSKKYYDDRYLHSFFGYFPAYDAKFLIFLYQKHPKGAQYASETLAEPFHDLTKFLISYYSVPPDR